MEAHNLATHRTSDRPRTARRMSHLIGHTQLQARKYTSHAVCSHRIDLTQLQARREELEEERARCLTEQATFAEEQVRRT